MKTITWTVEKFKEEIKNNPFGFDVFETESEIIEEAQRRFNNHVENIKKSAATIIELTETSISHQNNF